MKKLVLTLAVFTVCYTANAQEPEKKKESSTIPPPSRGQERAINESGVSVKKESKKKLYISFQNYRNLFIYLQYMKNNSDTKYITNYIITDCFIY